MNLWAENWQLGQEKKGCVVLIFPPSVSRVENEWWLQKHIVQSLQSQKHCGKLDFKIKIPQHFVPFYCIPHLDIESF